MGAPSHMAPDVPARDAGTRVRLTLSALLLLACPALMLFFSHAPASVFPAYRRLSKAIMGALAAASGIVPFALWDFLLVGLAALAIVALIRRSRRGEPVLPVLSHDLLVLSASLLVFVGGWACNHYAPPLAEDLGLEVGERSADELADATARYLEDAARLAGAVGRDDAGGLAGQDFFELARVAGASYGELADEWEIFEGSAAPVKALILAGEPLLYTGHVGVFVAPTGEAGVPLGCAEAERAFTMCHEAAHRLGVASEEEANFCAYLACEASDDVRLRYSGAYSAFCWCLNALLRVDAERAQQVVDDVAGEGLAREVALVLQDRAATRERYAAYEGPVEEAGTAMNDAYLKTFGQAEGVRSYGLVVDYLIAWNQADVQLRAG